MVFYITGKVTNIFNESIVIDVNGVGYLLYVSHTENYKLGDFKKVYIYRHIHEDERYLVGFLDLDEKRMFSLLISVNGLGPKTAMSMLRNAHHLDIYNAILSNNVSFLKKLPNVGQRGAEQIILDLKTRLSGKKGNPKQYQEVKEALSELGFKKKRIEEVLSEINVPNATSEEIIKIALSRLSKQ